jgi:ParB-like chromosome segregation protein Spo0J
MKIQCAYTELVDVDKLVAHPKNYNKHPDRQIEMLAKILTYQGQRLPIVVSKRSGFIVSGHGRLMAIKKLGWPQAACDYQEFENEAAEYAHMVADNKIAELAEEDNIILEDIRIDLGVDFDHELLGLKEDPSASQASLDDINTNEKEVDFEADKLKHECPDCGFVWTD